MSAAVIIVSWNVERFLPHALRCLERQTMPPTRTIVVDNDSDDTSVEIAERDFPGVEVIRMGSNVGFCRANNVGVGAADGCEYVALLNPDAYAEPEWLERLLAAAEAQPHAAAFGSRMMLASDPSRLDGAGDAYHVSGLTERRYQGRRLADVPQALVGGETFSVCAGAALYRRQAFLDLGGMDEDLFAYYEDSDLAFRLRLAGWRCAYVPDSVVLHVGSATTGVDSDFALYHIQRNLAWVWCKCMPWPLWLIYLPAHLYAHASMFAAYAVRRRGRIVLRAKYDALRGLPKQLRKRRQLQRRSRVRAASLMPIFRRGLGIFVPAAIRARRSRG